MAEHSEGSKETWNMATATMKRLNGLLIMSSMAAHSQDFDRWFQVLMDLRRNLAPFMESKEFDEVTKKLSSLPDRWNIDRTPKYRATIHRTFDEVYIIFIRCMKAKGLLMPESKDSGKSVIDM